MKRTVMIASAMKWTNRNTSMLVLSIGYIQSWNHLGMRTAQRGKYQVITTRNANNKYAAASPSTTRERRNGRSRSTPPTPHHAPNTKISCQVSGLKNHTPLGYEGRFQLRFQLAV